MRKKLLLINPAPESDLNMSTAVSILNFSPLSLAYIAALTPKNWEIEIIDENIERYKNEEADLVGLTSMTYNAPRAYALAAHFRERGTPTVLGGIHASFLPEEAMNFVDCVVVGEADTVWPRIIGDFENSRMKRMYSGGLSSLDCLVRPRRDLCPKSYNIKILVQTARGCPMDCDFCSVTAFSGRSYRQRPVGEVLDEIESMDSRLVFFLDDNILGSGKNAENRAIELFRGIVERKLKIKWSSQAPLSFADNEELLRCASESGCFGLFIGFESLDENSLKSMRKAANIRAGLDAYKSIVKKFQDYGIGVFGAFIFGSDGDKKDIFKLTSDFVLDSKMDGSQYAILTPLPGTMLFERFKRENRLLLADYPKDWAYYNMCNVVFQPKNMTPQELLDGTRSAYAKTMTMRQTVKRAFNSLVRTRNMQTAVTSFLWNYGYGSGYLKKFGARAT